MRVYVTLIYYTIYYARTYSHSSLQILKLNGSNPNIAAPLKQQAPRAKVQVSAGVLVDVARTLRGTGGQRGMAVTILPLFGRM